MTTPSVPTGGNDEHSQPTPLDGADLAENVPSPGELAPPVGEDPSGLFRGLGEGQTCRLHVFDVAARSDSVIAEFDHTVFEAPNWGADGNTLYLNGEGGLWAFPLESPAEPRRIAYEGLPALNNDHVLDPGGEAIFMSAMDGHIYRGALDGSGVRRVTDEDDVWHFLHGVSPDGTTLGFVRIDGAGGPGRLALVASDGGRVTVVDTGAGHIDGPEWSPDGEWIYFNTERWASKPGHAQLARVPSENPSADKIERLISTDTVDWFPHLAPNGRLAVYLQYPAGTVGHPVDHDVELVLVDTTDWSTPLARVPVFGGQGTINVNSWSPDSRRFAFVSYPHDTRVETDALSTQPSASEVERPR
ncbi:TolB family protein [Streptomyces sp. NPDC102274]|uniref:TolB family protein n=1 Tax=Streptomyces sp. NPDC102274 TaxID=3366151 RepID=UPI00380F7753